MDYKVDHIGIAVNDLKISIPLYERLLGEPCYKTEQVSSESVDTAFFLQNGAKIELLESLDPNGPIAKFIGNILVQALPKIIKSLSVIGTIALLLVAGGIFSHNIAILHHFMNEVPAFIKDLVLGLLVGLVALAFVTVFNKIVGKKV